MKVLIIGAGFSGLIAGVYACKAGMEVTILEQGATPGGVSTSWKRKGYFFEGGVHWLIGSLPRNPLHRIWKESGALQENNPVFVKDPVITLVNGDKKLELWRDIDRDVREWSAFSPRDRFFLKLLSWEVKGFKYFSHPVGRTSLWEYLRMLPAILLAPFLLSQSVGRYASRFRSPEIRALIGKILSESNNAMSLLYCLSSHCNGDGGYPHGGALQMARNIAAKFTALGGRILYRTRVDRILSRDGKVTGVQAGEQEIPADKVIISEDARTAIDHLFGAPLQEGWAVRMRRSLETMQCMFLCIGTDAFLTEYPRSLNFLLKEPFEAAGLTFNNFNISCYSGDPFYAPEGGSVLTCLLIGNSHAFWKAAREDGTYAARKQDVVSRFLSVLETLMPETKGHIAVTDMATPVTYERYCSTHEGSWMSIWRPMTTPAHAPMRYKGIEGVYFTGQRTSFSGGLPPAALSGRKVVRLLCKDAGIPFRSNI